MKELIAVETMTLVEVSDMFRRSIEVAMPKAKVGIATKMKKLAKAKVSSHKWVQTYEEFKNAKLNFYCEKVPTLTSPITSIGMSHRTTKGMILVAVDVSNGGIPVKTMIEGRYNRGHWQKWVHIYTSHCCERYAERIAKLPEHTFSSGSEAIMFSDVTGAVTVIDKVTEELEVIDYHFKNGMLTGYRDSKSKIAFFNTVYSNDMLMGNRRTFRDEWQLPIDALQELFTRY